jgi:hypothetical protein
VPLLGETSNKRMHGLHLIEPKVCHKKFQVDLPNNAQNKTLETDPT